MDEKPTYFVNLPPREGLAGSVMRGHTMGPLKNGWILYYYDHKSRPTDEHLDELCVVMTESGEKLTRYLKRGHLPGTFDLLTVSGPPAMDVPLKWAERVVLIQPHVLSGEELSLLNSAAAT